MSRIACKGIWKSFGNTRVLEGLDLEVPDGAVVTVLGASGSGKTTLLRLIAGFERPDSGTILIDDEVVDSARHFVAPERRRIGYVAQEGDLFPHLTVARNIGFGLARREGSRSSWSWSASRGSVVATPTSSPAGSSSESRSRGHLRRTPASSCSTSRFPRWTPACARRCAST